MQRNIMMTLVSIGLSTCAFADGDHPESASFKITPITEQISMLQGQGGNVAVLTGEQGILMIDDDYQKMSSALQDALKEFGGKENLTYIINTHWHGDHTGGNLDLGSSTRIIAHDNVRERLLTKQEIKLFNMVSEPYPEEALPSLTYSQHMTLHINGETVELEHYPQGHTDSDSVVFFKAANVVHTGDHFFNGFFPFIDVDSGGNAVTMAENVAKLIQQIDEKTVIIPGHGPLAKKADLEAFHGMLTGTTQEVKAMMDSGMTIEQIQEKGLSSDWDEWTDGFLSTEAWINILYASLKAA